MPGYKRKRYSRTRKGYGKRKKRSYKKKPKLGRLGLAKLQSRPHHYFAETRAVGLHNASVDTIGLYAITAPGNGVYQTNNRVAFGSSDDMNGIMTAAGGLSALGDENETTGKAWHIFKYSVSITMRNVEKDPCIVKIYLLTNIDALRTEVTAEPTTLGTPVLQMFRDLHAGWDKFTAAANFTNAGLASPFVPFGRQGAAGGYDVGSHAIEIVTPALNTDSTTDMTINSKFLNLKNSIGFLKRWKVLKAATRKLQPGDEWLLPFKVPARTYTADDYSENEVVTNYNDALGYFNLLAKPGHVRIPLVFVQGLTGYLATNQNVYNLMDTNIALQLVSRAQVLPIVTTGYNNVMHLEQDVRQTEANLRGPSDFAAAAGD